MRNVRFINDVSLACNVPADPGGTSPLSYERVQSVDPANFVDGATCSAQEDTFCAAPVEETPNPGETFFILMRGSNVCGTGTLGADSFGAIRLGIPCP